MLMKKNAKNDLNMANKDIQKSKKVYFITGNKYKTAIFNDLMTPEFNIQCLNPKKEIEELETRSVKNVVVDKLDKAFNLFPNSVGYLFVTDVGLFIEQLNGKPGALIKPDTKKLFKGNFHKWCAYVDSSKPRNAYIQMIIAAKNQQGKTILVDHKVQGYISKQPQPGEYGFAWDDIFVPNENYVSAEFKNKSFAQIPENIKYDILMIPPIKEFKQRLLE